MSSFVVSAVATTAVVLSNAAAAVQASTTGWDRLETTWAPLFWNGFFSVPTSIDKAKSSGWTQVSSCSNDATMGELYADNGDLSTMPYFDGYTGQLLGISLAVPYIGSYELQSGQPWVKRRLSNGTIYYAVQFAFQDPSMICSSSEDATSMLADVSSNYIGEGLWIRKSDTGIQSEDWIMPPLKNDENSLNQVGYDQGRCFVQMGQHWWYNDTSADQDCNELFPVFLLYNGGNLNAFGIANSQTDFPYQSSKRWEHPKGSDTSIFFQKGKWPTCLDTSRVLNTQHVYLNNPAWMNCL